MTAYPCKRNLKPEEAREFMKVARQSMSMLKREEIKKDQRMFDLSKSISHKIQETVKLQNDRSYLTSRCLPTVPKAYKMPTIAVEPNIGTTKIATADSYSKASHNGYDRKGCGGFYAH